MRTFLLFISLLLTIGLFAQSAAQADALFNDQKYEESGRAYATLLNQRPNDALYNYRYARCNYEIGNYDKAITHFIKSGTRYPLRDFYLADSYFISYKFDEAVEYFTTYMENSPTGSFIQQAEDKLRRAQIAERLSKRVEAIEVLDSITVNKKEFLKHYDLSKETGHFNIERITTPNKRLLDLVSFVTQRGDRKIFTDVVENRTRLFSSNKLLVGWSKPEYVSENLNSEGDEAYPFLMLDGVTLYFASNNENSIGGYDIFITRYNPNIDDYLSPENIGFPFNSIYNDYMYVIDEIRNTGWFVTDRHQQKDKVTIYKFKHQDEKSYVDVDDEDYLILAAQLKVYEKGDEDKVEVSSSSDLLPEEDIIKVEKLVTQPSSSMNFQINDTLIYTNTKQFRSPKALQLWQEWDKLSADLSKKETAVSSLRTKYAQLDANQDKSKISDEILSLEKQILTIHSQISNKVLYIRNEEIKTY